MHVGEEGGEKKKGVSLSFAFYDWKEQRESQGQEEGGGERGKGEKGGGKKRAGGSASFLLNDFIGRDLTENEGKERKGKKKKKKRPFTVPYLFPIGEWIHCQDKKKKGEGKRELV